MDKTARELLKKVADIDEVPKGAHSIREDGGSLSLYSTENVKIRAREDKMGIDIAVLPNTVGETVHIPVIITASGLKERVINTFTIGEGSYVTIVAGCGIHNCGTAESQHDGLHTFYLKKNARRKYTEKHYGEGDGGKRILNPETELFLDPGAQAILEMVQIEGRPYNLEKCREGDIQTGLRTAHDRTQQLPGAHPVRLHHHGFGDGGQRAGSARGASRGQPDP